MPIAGQRFELEKRAKLDPKLLRLAHASDHPDLLSNIIFSSVVKLADGFDGSALDANTVLKRVLVKLRHGRIPPLLQTLKWARVVDELYSVSVPITKLSALAQDDGVEFISMGGMLGTALNTSLAEIRADRVHTGLHSATAEVRTGRGVIVGIIDAGFDFTLDDFRDETGKTRIAFFWNQQLQAVQGETSPEKFDYGVEYTAAAIDAALQTTDPFQKIRSKVPLTPQAHGTHVAGIAVGNGRTSDNEFPEGQYKGVAPAAEIILVQPDSTDAQTSFTDSVHVADAIAYIFERAAEIGRPCVINMSMGQNGGSHDGESQIERAIDRLVEAEPGRAVVLAAGNEHVWRGHAEGSLATGETRTLHWKVGGPAPLPFDTESGSDPTLNEMEIWFSSRELFRVRLVEPDGERTDFVEPGDTVFFSDLPGGLVFITSTRFTPLNGKSQIYIEVNPKASSPLADAVVKKGIWKVEIQAVESREGDFHAWIERDYRAGIFGFDDQSYFLGSDFAPTHTLGTPATSRRAISVANYDHETQAINESSSRGPTTDGRQKPEVAAPGTKIFSANSLGGRTLPNTSTPISVRYQESGTSMSAPHVSGVVALMLEANPNLTASQIRAILIASARPPQPHSPGGFDRSFGFGIVDATEAVRLAETLI